jgi:transposase
MDAMMFLFYPKHEHGCPHVGHCPHVGGASLGSVVLAANESLEQHGWLWRQIDGLRAEKTSLYEKNVALQKQVEQLKLELKLERQNKFATNRQKQESSQQHADAEHLEAGKSPKKETKGSGPILFGTRFAHRE